MENNTPQQPQINSQQQTAASIETSITPRVKLTDSKSKKSLLVVALIVLYTVSILATYFLALATKNNTQSSNVSSSKTSEAEAVGKNEKSNSANIVPSIVDSTNWVSYSPNNSLYEVGLPPGWILTTAIDNNDLIAWSASQLPYVTDMPGRVYQNIPGLKYQSEGKTTAFYLIYDYKDNEKSYLSPDLVKKKTYSTKNSLQVTKSKRTQTDESKTNGGMDIPLGTTQYVYDILGPGKNIQIVHDVLEGENDQSKVVEAMIESLKFL